MLFESLLSTFELVVAIKHGLYVNSKILCVVLCGDQKRAPLFAPPFNFSQKFSCYMAGYGYTTSSCLRLLEGVMMYADLLSIVGTNPLFRS